MPLSSGKRQKKSSSQIGRQGSEPVACFRGIIFARGARSLPGGEGVTTGFYVADLDSYRFRDEDQKKGLCHEICGFVIVFTRAFVLEQKCTYAWGGGTSSIFGGAQDPKSTLVAPGQLLWFGVQSLLGGHIFRLGGSSSD